MHDDDPDREACNAPVQLPGIRSGLTPKSLDPPTPLPFFLFPSSQPSIVKVT